MSGLLAGMLVKHVVGASEIGARVFGPIHGAIFLLCVAAALVTWGALRWSAPVVLLALAAAVPPLGSIAFERWATRAGHLEEPGDDPAAPTRA